MKKIFAISIILLFIGVAVAPSIGQSVVKASIDDDLAEITTHQDFNQLNGNETPR